MSNCTFGFHLRILIQTEIDMIITYDFWFLFRLFFFNFKSKKIFADLIYIDGSHEYEDVYQDLKNYNPLLNPNGIIWGDDWHIHAHGVVAAVTQFAHENSLNLVNDHKYNKWFLAK